MPHRRRTPTAFPSRHNEAGEDEKPVLPPQGDDFDGSPDPEPEYWTREPNSDRQLPAREPSAPPWNAGRPPRARTDAPAAPAKPQHRRSHDHDR